MNEKQYTGVQAKTTLLKAYLFACVVVVASVCLFVACDKSGDNAASFGKVVTASEVDSNNAPTALSDTFSTQQRVIYIVAEAKELAPGTRLAAKWSRDGTVVQISDEVIATQGYRNSNVEFHMTPGVTGWMPGKYTAQIMVNGQPGPKTTFIVK
ncbi:MAG TPA: hypothetical protein VIT91_08680 [Chthoniobacterales bacterium]